MKNLITLCIIWKFITDKDLKGIQLYLLPFLAIFYIMCTIAGDLTFIAVRLLHLNGKIVQKNFSPILIVLALVIPILLIYIYDRNTDIDLLRKEISSMVISDIKKIKIKAIVTIAIIALLPIISLSIFSILIKLNII